MNSSVDKTIEILSEYIQQVIENGSDEELKLLPELVSSLAEIISSLRS